MFALEDVGLCPGFYGSNVKECNLFTFRSIRLWEITSFPKICTEIMHHSMLPLFISCTITELCAISSLALDNWRQKYCQTLGSKPNPSIPIIFDRFTVKFLKNRRLLGKIKNTVSLRFMSLSFPNKKSSPERTGPSLLATNSLYKEKGQWPLPIFRRKNIHAVCCDDKFKLFNIVKFRK